MIDIRRLRVLREVARQGSLSAAAGALGYTQPAVSRQIAVLEAEVGTTLLRRLPQGVALTDAGALLVDRAEEVLRLLDQVEDEVRAHSGLEGGSLRMAAFASAAISIIPLALARFRERHPAIELSVSVVDPEESLPMLRSGLLDLAICNHGDVSSAERRGRRPQDLTGLRLDLLPLFEDPMYVALPAEHPLVDLEDLSLGDLAAGPWMLPTTGTCPDAVCFRDACRAAEVKPEIAFEYDDYAALLSFVNAEVGMSVIPDMVAREVRPGVVLRQLNPPLAPRQISAAVPAGYRSPATVAMLDILGELAPEWVDGRLDPARLAPTGRPARIGAWPNGTPTSASIASSPPR